MPFYTFECCACGRQDDQRRTVDDRNREVACPDCLGSLMFRKFNPTANVFTWEHFRHMQGDFLPPKGDPAWEHLGRNDQLHEPREEGPTLREHLQREFLGGT